MQRCEIIQTQLFRIPERQSGRLVEANHYGFPLAEKVREPLCNSLLYFTAQLWTFDATKIPRLILARRSHRFSGLTQSKSYNQHSCATKRHYSCCQNVSEYSSMDDERLPKNRLSRHNYAANPRICNPKDILFR